MIDNIANYHQEKNQQHRKKDDETLEACSSPRKTQGAVDLFSTAVVWVKAEAVWDWPAPFSLVKSLGLEAGMRPAHLELP